MNVCADNNVREAALIGPPHFLAVDRLKDLMLALRAGNLLRVHGSAFRD
jgi:hypothetical protein